MLEWLPRLAASPEEAASAHRHDTAMIGYTAQVPGTYAFVDYTIAEQFRTVLIIRVTDVRIDP